MNPRPMVMLGGRVSSHCRFINRAIDYLSESGMKWMSGGAKRQCGRTLPGGQRALRRELPVGALRQRCADRRRAPGAAQPRATTTFSCPLYVLQEESHMRYTGAHEIDFNHPLLGAAQDRAGELGCVSPLTKRSSSCVRHFFCGADHCTFSMTDHCYPFKRYTDGIINLWQILYIKYSSLQETDSFVIRVWSFGHHSA